MQIQFTFGKSHHVVAVPLFIDNLNVKVFKDVSFHVFEFFLKIRGFEPSICII